MNNRRTDNMGVERTSTTANASIDWITMTKEIDEGGLKSLRLSLGEREGWDRSSRRNRNGYKYCDSNGAISLMYNSDCGQVTVEMPGSGVRELSERLKFQSEKDWQQWFSDRLDEGWSFSRTDYAFDDVSRHLTIDDIFQRVRDGHLTTGAKKKHAEAEFGSKLRGELPTIYFGSKTSEKLLRIYDKDAQRGLRTSMLRVEMQVRKRTANEWAGLFARGGFAAIAPLIAGFVTFKVPHPSDTNKSRWDDWEPWRKVMGEAGRSSVKGRPLDHPRRIDTRAQWYVDIHSRKIAEIVDNPRFGRRWLEWMLVLGRTERGVSLPEWESHE